MQSILFFCHEMFDMIIYTTLYLLLRTYFSIKKVVLLPTGTFSHILFFEKQYGGGGWRSGGSQLFMTLECTVPLYRYQVPGGSRNV